MFIIVLLFFISLESLSPRSLLDTSLFVCQPRDHLRDEVYLPLTHYYLHTIPQPYPLPHNNIHPHYYSNEPISYETPLDVTFEKPNHAVNLETQPIPHSKIQHTQSLQKNSPSHLNDSHETVAQPHLEKFFAFIKHSSRLENDKNASHFPSREVVQQSRHFNHRPIIDDILEIEESSVSMYFLIISRLITYIYLYFMTHPLNFEEAFFLDSFMFLLIFFMPQFIRRFICHVLRSFRFILFPSADLCATFIQIFLEYLPFDYWKSLDPNIRITIRSVVYWTIFSCFPEAYFLSFFQSDTTPPLPSFLSVIPQEECLSRLNETHVVKKYPQPSFWESPITDMFSFSRKNGLSVHKKVSHWPSVTSLDIHADSQFIYSISDFVPFDCLSLIHHIRLNHPHKDHLIQILIRVIRQSFQFKHDFFESLHICHGDPSPVNIRFNHSFHIKIIDFDLTRDLNSCGMDIPFFEKYIRFIKFHAPQLDKLSHLFQEAKKIHQWTQVIQYLRHHETPLPSPLPFSLSDIQSHFKPFKCQYRYPSKTATSLTLSLGPHMCTPSKRKRKPHAIMRSA